MYDLLRFARPPFVLAPFPGEARDRLLLVPVVVEVVNVFFKFSIFVPYQEGV